MYAPSLSAVTTTLALFASLLPLTNAGGITCSTSHTECLTASHPLYPTAAGNEVAYLAGLLNNLNNQTIYHDTTYLACTVTNNDLQANPYKGVIFCAGLQGTNGAPGQMIKELAAQLVGNGCGTCGSVPLLYPASNDDSQGTFVIDMVGNGCFGSNPPTQIGLCN